MSVHLPGNIVSHRSKNKTKLYQASRCLPKVQKLDCCWFVGFQRLAWTSPPVAPEGSRELLATIHTNSPKVLLKHRAGGSCATGKGGRGIRGVFLRRDTVCSEISFESWEMRRRKDQKQERREVQRSTIELNTKTDYVKWKKPGTLIWPNIGFFKKN